jgi:stage II sporulation protein GA (sporulation sigma-E factor processing peptidase)
MIVYVDTLIFTNTIVDFILLTATDFIVRRQSSILRSIIASVAGGLSSLYIFLQSDTLIFDLLFKALISVIIVIITNGFRRSFWIYLCVFLGLSFTLNGVTIFLAHHFSSVIYSYNFINYYDVSPIVLILVTAVIYVSVRVIQRKRERGKCYEAELRVFICSVELNLNALIDTGNSIIDPFGNSEIFIISPNKFKIAEECLSDNEVISRKRIIPIKTVGGTDILTGYRCDKAIVFLGKDQYIFSKVIVVSAKEELNGRYNALISPDSLERISDL